MNIIRYWKFIE